MLEVALGLVAYFGSVASILGLGFLLDEHRSAKFKEFRRRVGKELAETASHDLSFWMHETNQAFLNAFDFLYSRKEMPSSHLETPGPLYEQAIWSGLLLSPVLLLLLRVISLVREGQINTVDLLLFAIILAFSVSLSVGIIIRLCFRTQIGTIFLRELIIPVVFSVMPPFHHTVEGWVLVKIAGVFAGIMALSIGIGICIW